MGPCTGHGSGGTRISSAYNVRWQVSIPSFKCVTFGHVIHKLVQHIPKEGGSEQEGDLSFQFHSIKVCNICYLASIFIEQNSTHDCCFRFFIYKNPSALAYQGCQQSPYNKDNNKLN